MKNKYYLKFTGKYFLRVVTLLIAVSIISFVLVSLSPVDPVQQYVGSVPNVSMEQRAKIAEYWGLNKPPVEQFLAWGKSMGWFPMGMSVPKGVPADEVTILQRIHHLILPALTLSFLSFANVALHTREKLVDVLESDFVLFAKARGESTWSVLKRHGLRNIMLPAITMQFGSFSELFGGSVLAENVFSYPGLGAAASAAGMGSDIPLLLGITLFSALFVFVGNMLANIIYGVVDPQIREGYHNESNRS